VVVAADGTPYEVLRNQLVEYLSLNPNAKLYVTGHSLGGALAAVFTGALLHDDGREERGKEGRRRRGGRGEKGRY
jgi:hypothetical protein